MRMYPGDNQSYQISKRLVDGNKIYQRRQQILLKRTNMMRKGGRSHFIRGQLGFTESEFKENTSRLLFHNNYIIQ